MGAGSAPTSNGGAAATPGQEVVSVKRLWAEGSWAGRSKAREHEKWLGAKFPFSGKGKRNPALPRDTARYGTALRGGTGWGF